MDTQQQPRLSHHPTTLPPPLTHPAPSPRPPPPSHLPPSQPSSSFDASFWEEAAAEADVGQHPQNRTTRTQQVDQQPEPGEERGESGAQGTTASQKKRDEDGKKEKDRNRYFAGQSVMKAGLKRDQGEINAIIASASTGSKFYVQQMKKEEELTVRCARLVAKRDELMKHANIPKLEKEVDDLIVELEAGRDLTQHIVHVDMDAFYAAVEMKRDPSLKGKCFGVGSGVLTTASYEARQYGCRSGMAGFVARKLCPHIIFVKPNFELYSAASRDVISVLRLYDENLAMASLDEGYLNITSYMATHDMAASEVVSDLRAAVVEKTGLTISAGIAPTKMLAKICSDKNKPNGQFELDFNSAAIRKFMHDLPVRRIPGIGKVAERVVNSFGVETCGDVYQHRAALKVMNHWIGLNYMLKAYLGLGSNHVEPGKRESRKSVGCERTFRDKEKEEDILEMLGEIAEHLERDLDHAGFSGRTVTVKYKLHTYEVMTRALTVNKYISTAEEILPIAEKLLVKEFPMRIRLLGIRMTNLKDLRAKEKGLNKFFNKSPTKGSSDKQDFVNSGSDDDDALSRIGSDVEMPDADEPGPSNKHARSSSSSVLSAPKCPICSCTLVKMNNLQINSHVDQCIGGIAEDDEDDVGGADGVDSPLKDDSSDFEIVGVREGASPGKSKLMPESRTIVKGSKKGKPEGSRPPKNAFSVMMKAGAKKTKK